MKVICDRTALLNAVTLVAGVVVGRTPTQVLKCIKLTAEDRTLTLAATDLEIGLRLDIEQVDIQEPGVVLLPADKLLQIVRACDDPTLTIHNDDHATHIRGADSHFKVFGYDPKDFPNIRAFGDIKVDCEVEAGNLQLLVSRTLFATASEHSRYAINGVLFERQAKKLRLVATDGRRLAVARGSCKTGEGNGSCIIPTKALNLLNRLINDPDAIVKIGVEQNQIVFAVPTTVGAAVLSSNLVEGAFPPFEDVIPKDQDKKATFDTAALSSAVSRAALLTNDESRGVRLSFASKRVTLTSRAPEMGEAEIHLDVQEYTGDPLEIGFNPQYITDALKVVESGQVMIELKTSSKPGVLKAGNDFTYVLMPVNLG